MASDKQFVFIYLGIALFFNVMGLDANSFWPPFKQTLTPTNGDNSKDKGKICNFCSAFSPCKNGKCVNKECGFTCECNEFYVGLHCETYIKNNPWIEQNVNVATTIQAVKPTTTTTTTTTTTATTTTTTTTKAPTTKPTSPKTKSTSITTKASPSAKKETTSTKTATSHTTKPTSTTPTPSATAGTIKPIISGNNLPLKSNKIITPETATGTTTVATAKGGLATQQDKIKNPDVNDKPPTTASTTTTTSKKGSTQQEDD